MSRRSISASIEESEVDELQAKAEWRFPTDRPAYAQGMVAQVPVKLLFTGDKVLVLAATIIADYLEERL